MPITNKKEIIKTQITKLNPQKTKPEKNQKQYYTYLIIILKNNLIHTETSYWCNICFRILVCWIYIIMTYQICNCCVSSGWSVSACYWKQVEDSNFMDQNSYTNIINKGMTKFWSYESKNVERVSGWFLLIHKICNLRV